MKITSVIDPYLEHLAKKFWDDIGGVTKWPCELDKVVALTLPVTIVDIKNLKVSLIKDWLIDRNVCYTIPSSERKMLGCLLAFRGIGFIFIDKNLSHAERQFTLGHEISHFLLDYHIPREKALNQLGPAIIEVLDGQRPASSEERIVGILNQIVIGAHFHLLDACSDGSFLRSDVIKAESRADELAVELLAPFEIVCAHVYENCNSCSYSEYESTSRRLLLERFGLPLSICFSYSKLIARHLSNAPGALKSMGIDL